MITLKLCQTVLTSIQYYLFSGSLKASYKTALDKGCRPNVQFPKWVLFSYMYLLSSNHTPYVTSNHRTLNSLFRYEFTEVRINVKSPNIQVELGHYTFFR